MWNGAMADSRGNERSMEHVHSEGADTRRNMEHVSDWRKGDGIYSWEGHGGGMKEKEKWLTDESSDLLLAKLCPGEN